MDVNIAVCTFGGDEWRQLALSRAVPSARAQGVPVHAIHGASLAEARNAALTTLTSEWIIYLDADDELEPGYVAAMAAATADIRACAIREVIDGQPQAVARMPRVNGAVATPDVACILRGNWIAIGAAVRRQMLISAGWWQPWPMYEDWDMWMRCMLRGATAEPVPTAVYRAHVRRGSRNRALPTAQKLEVRRQILAANVGDRA